MNLGDKVFTVRSTGWGHRDSFRAGVISKTTPTGLVDVTSGTYTVRFDKTGREYGKRYNGERIDTAMTFEQRQEQLNKEERIDRAHGALTAVKTAERVRYNSKEELLEEIKRLQSVLNHAEELAASV